MAIRRYIVATTIISLICLSLLFHRSYYGETEDSIRRSSVFSYFAPAKCGRITMVTMASSEKLKDFDGVQDFYQKIWDNRMSYADAHGYTFMLLDAKNFSVPRKRSLVWSKLPAIAAAMDANPSAEWVWWLDIDAIIMTPQLELCEHLLSPEAMKSRLLKGEKLAKNDRVLVGKEVLEEFQTGEIMDPSMIDFLFVQDAMGLNAGSFFIRNTPTTRLFVDFLNDPILVNYASDKWLLQDQDLLVYHLFHHPTFRKRVGWIQQNTFNAYPTGSETTAWRPGNLVVHFPSCGSINKCAEAFNDFWPQREKLEEFTGHLGRPPKLIGQDH